MKKKKKSFKGFLFIQFSIFTKEIFGSAFASLLTFKLTAQPGRAALQTYRIPLRALNTQRDMPPC